MSHPPEADYFLRKVLLQFLCELWHVCCERRTFENWLTYKWIWIHVYRCIMIGLFGGPVHNAEVGHVRKVSGNSHCFIPIALRSWKNIKTHWVFFSYFSYLYVFIFWCLTYMNMKSMKKVRREGYICNSRSSKYTRSWKVETQQTEIKVYSTFEFIECKQWPVILKEHALLCLKCICFWLAKWDTW